MFVKCIRIHVILYLLSRCDLRIGSFPFSFITHTCSLKFKLLTRPHKICKEYELIRGGLVVTNLSSFIIWKTKKSSNYWTKQQVNESYVRIQIVLVKNFIFTISLDLNLWTHAINISFGHHIFIIKEHLFFSIPYIKMPTWNTL